jgi:hypothetical protein
MSADLDATEDGLLAALERGPDRPTPFVVSGEVTVTWDGSTCVAAVSDSMAPGMTNLSFDNASGAPAGLAFVRVTPPHTWDELRALLATPELIQEAPPEWVSEAGFIGDEAGEGDTRSTTALIGDAGTHGAVCMEGEWPELTFTLSEPIEVAP